MKTFKLSFGHPFKGKASLNCESSHLHKTIPLDTHGSNLLEISLDGLQQGTWRMLLEWQFDGREFSHSEDLVIS